MGRRSTLFSLVCLFWLLTGMAPLAQTAGAAPVITRFESMAELDTGGTLTVTETITADMPGGGHGMFREIPVAVRLPSGHLATIPPTVLAVTLDGTPLSPTDTERMPSNVLRISMRDTSTTLNAGAHTFTLTYSMPYMVGYFADHDELNWNVTGNLWSVPIEHAEYTLVLPPGAEIDMVSGWVGKAGSREDAVNIDRENVTDTSRIRFTSQRVLEPGEGLTCAVSWNKGVEQMNLDLKCYTFQM